MANQDLQDKHADDLSASRYTLKKVRETVIGVGSLVGGVFAGGMIGGWMSKGKNLPTNAMPEGLPFIGGKRYNLKQQFGGLIGAFVGTLVGGLYLGYEHWRKVESQRIAVDEINKDIASTVAIQPVDKELVAENKRLREMLEARSNAPEHLQEKKHAETHPSKHSAGMSPKSHTEHAQTKSTGELGVA
jgi:hypothetical protein